jgi:hypothetical protein
MLGMKRFREENSFGLFTSHTKRCDPDEALSHEIHSSVLSNWSSWTNISLTLEQIDNSFAESATEKAIDTWPTSGDNNEDVDEVIEYIDVIGKCKKGPSIYLIDSTELISSVIGIMDDRRDPTLYFSHNVTCNDHKEYQPSSDMFSSINQIGKLEVGLALEGLQEISALDRLCLSLPVPHSQDK